MFRGILAFASKEGRTHHRDAMLHRSILVLNYPLCTRPISKIRLIEVVHMKRVLLISIAVAMICVTGAAVVSGKTASSRPQGVSAGQWIAITEKLGFVVLPPSSIASGAADPDALLVKPPVEGYFMVKDNIGWSRIAIAEPVFGPGGT
jgi:hypothetical protein